MELVIISVIVLTVCFTVLTAAAANRETEAPSEQAAADQAPQTTNQGPPIGKLAIFWPPLVYMLFFLMSMGGMQQIYGGVGDAAKWAMGFIVCFLVLPGVALVQIGFGIYKNRTGKDSGQLHILSALLVGGMVIVYFLYVSGGGWD